MPLDWNISRIKDSSKVCFVDDGKDTKLSTLTRTLIFATMHVGIPRITEENAVEFFNRCHIHEQVVGNWQYRLSEDQDPKTVAIYIKLDDVKSHIGLSTNASRLTDAVFNKRVIEHLYADAKTAMENQTALAQVADAKDPVPQG